MHLQILVLAQTLLLLAQLLQCHTMHLQILVLAQTLLVLAQ
jgi:hypothetical protein